MIGYPSDTEISKISNKKAREFIHSLKFMKRKSSLKLVMQDVNPLAIDLVSKMLRFDPDSRITV